MRNVLIVDDNEIERLVLSAILANAYTVLQAGSGAEMLSILRHSGKSVSAVLLDIVMPGMDGYEALRAIRENAVWGQIPVIVTTALSDEQSQLKAMRRGANGYATKPYNPALLLYSLNNAIELREKSALLNAMRTDPLTGLWNREGFLDTAAHMIARQSPGYYMLSGINIENFKVVNDQYGTEMGDAVLKHIAACVERCARAVDGIGARFTADRFAILYPVKFKDAPIIQQVLREARVPPCINHKLKVRIGRYLVSDPTVPVSAMCDRAAMAEESIRDKYDFHIAEYTTSMRDAILHEQRIVNDMTVALANDEFTPWFQPQYDHTTGALIGAEALVRWQKGDRLIPPDEFIGIFERNGFIYEMDQYIWRQVCIHLRTWLDAGKSPLPVSVNVSRYDIYQRNFFAVICGLVEEYALPPALLPLEVTESAFAEASGWVCEAANQLIAYGFTVEIDDFGSGYSSLNTLKDVPASILKLDMKFFENTANPQRSDNIIESMVRMAHALGMSVIAEGVEEPAQADYLMRIGCRYIQGYYYGKPMPLPAYEALQQSGARKNRERMGKP